MGKRLHQILPRFSGPRPDSSVLKRGAPPLGLRASRAAIVQVRAGPRRSAPAASRALRGMAYLPLSLPTQGSCRAAAAFLCTPPGAAPAVVAAFASEPPVARDVFCFSVSYVYRPSQGSQHAAASSSSSASSPSSSHTSTVSEFHISGKAAVQRTCRAAAAVSRAFRGVTSPVWPPVAKVGLEPFGNIALFSDVLQSAASS